VTAAEPRRWHKRPLPAVARAQSTQSATGQRSSNPVSRVASSGARRLTVLFGGPARARVIVVLASVLALASADTATVGAAARNIRSYFHIGNGDIGLLVAATSLVAALASIPFGMLADRVRRTWTLSFAVALWGVAMLGSASAGSFGDLLLWRVGLGVVTAAAGPGVASLVGDYFPGSERGRIYSYILTGELVGAGVGFVIAGDISTLAWQAGFVVLGLPAFVLAWALFKLPEPVRGGAGALVSDSAKSAPEDGGTEGGRAAGYADRTEATETTAQLGPESPTPPMGLGAPTPTASASSSSSAASDATADDESSRFTDAQRLAAQRGVTADPELVQRGRRKRIGVISATKYVLDVKTNVALIISGALGYYFLAGVQTFGIEFVGGQYHINSAFANLLMLVVGGGAAVGVIAAGPISDGLLHRGHLNARILVPALASCVTVVLFIPALTTQSVLTALPYVVIAAAALSAQNPPIDAARLDIMPATLWGRAEGIRTFLRTLAQALAPLLFGLLSDYISLRDTFLVMLLPLSLSVFFLFRAMRTYPKDVATAAAVMDVGPWASSNTGSAQRNP
jgi:MFS family permease